MAIVNLTPDSFYATSRNTSHVSVMESICNAVAEGASIVDLGGYSTRPGAAIVDTEEEWRRVRMGLEAARMVDCGVVISIDTFRSEVVHRAYEEFGAFIVNDISAGEADEQMTTTVARYDIPYVAMHMRGTPQSMQSMTEYEHGVVRGVVDYFRERVPQLKQAGIDEKNIILDPGFGFAKGVEQNWELLRGLDELRALGRPILIGVSRKSMMYKLLGVTPEEVLPGSLALAWEVLRSGPAILRVHDVAATRQVMELSNYYRGF
ncbi:MAG: dihydropteroate synthase [Alistipes sp.]|nr:dihydropteroate synthase [Alistipes sp.]